MRRGGLAWVAIAAATLVVVLVYFTASPPSPPEQVAPPPSASVAAAPDAPDVEPVSTGGTERDFQALVEAALRIDDPSRRRAVLAAILTDWLRADAAGFEKYLMLLEVDGRERQLAQLADGLRDALATLEPAEATSEAVLAPLRRFVLHLTRRDADEALAWADAWLVDDYRDTALVQIAGALAQRSPTDGIAVAKAMTSPLRRMQAYATVGSVWARSDGEAAVAWASTLRGPTERAMTLNAALMAMAQTDAGAAAGHLSTAELSMAQDYYAQYLADLAAMNVTEAELANAPDVYEELANAGTLPPPTSADVELLAEAARVIAGKLALGDGAAGTAWAEALASEFLRASGVKGALAGWSQADPAAAAAFVADNYGTYREMVTAVYETWADGAPADAAAATRLLADDRLRAVATGAVVEAWATDEPARAARWVDGLPRAEQTDALRLTLATALSAADPEAAWDRARTIQDPSMQYRALKVAFAELVIQKPAAARELLAASNLTGKTAERLQELLAAGEVG